MYKRYLEKLNISYIVVSAKKKNKGKKGNRSIIF